MKLAFCLFKYFPFGGLQRDFLKIAQACRARGHIVHVYTTEWQGENEPELNIHVLPIKGLQNHVRNAQFVKQIKNELAKEHFDLVIGFNKMPHLDLYYAADVCYLERIRCTRPFFYSFLPRYRRLLALEKAVFAQGQKTEVLLISPAQEEIFVHHYHTEKERFHLLPPGIAKDRIAPPHAASIRSEMRQMYQLTDHDILLLMVGSGFKTKGLDRSIRALYSLPEELKQRTQLFVVGEDNPHSFIKLAKRLGVSERLHFLGGQSTVLSFFLAADLLLHPSYHENTGTVILEALVAGLPVLTVASCGYAHYVTESNAGYVLPDPFDQIKLNEALQKMLLSAKRKEWQQNGLNFAKEADIYRLPEKAVEIIESMGQKRVSP